MERTLVLIKPGAMQRSLAGEVLSRLERRGLRIAALRLFQMAEELARRRRDCAPGLGRVSTAMGAPKLKRYRSFRRTGWLSLGRARGRLRDEKDARRFTVT